MNVRRGMYSHAACGEQISVLAGTIFEKSTQDLCTWFEAIYLIFISDGKIPVMELGRKIGFDRYTKAKFIAYKTPWRMKRLICEYLGIPSKDYSYKFSSKRNGRYAQIEAKAND